MGTNMKAKLNQVGQHVNEDQNMLSKSNNIAKSNIFALELELNRTNIAKLQAMVP